MKNSQSIPVNTSYLRAITLEPRVAALESGLDHLAADVKDLATVVRAQGQNVEHEMQKLVIAVTQAQAPKKTDWSLFISIGFFILALGSAVFWPLNKTGQDNVMTIQRLEQKLDAHMQLPLHPVGQARVDSIEKLMNEREVNYQTQHRLLDEKIQRETALLLANTDTKVSDLDFRIQKEFNALNMAMDLRVGHIEQYVIHENFSSLDELRRWRLGELRYGITTPPLIK